MTTQATSGNAIVDAFLNPVANFVGETLDRGKEYIWTDWFGQSPNFSPVATPANAAPTTGESVASQGGQTIFGMSPAALGAIAAGAVLLVVLLKD